MNSDGARDHLNDKNLIFLQKKFDVRVTVHP